MIAKFFVVLSVVAIANAGPVIYETAEPIAWRVGRAPNVAFGFGSGFSSNIGGISQSSGIGASFQSGDASAYGAGIGSSDGNTFASGIGYAQAAPIQPYRPSGLQQANPAAFNNALGRYGSAVSSSQNFGNFGTAVSSAQNQNGFGSAVSSAVNNGLGHYQTAQSSVQNLRGLGYDSAISSASSNGLGGYGSSTSLVQSRGLNNYGTTIAASQNFPGYRSSIAQSVQQRGGSFQHSGASSVNAPGVQAAQSHAINTGYY